MSAALALVGGAAMASTALATERAADADNDRQLEDGEGSGDGAEEMREDGCKPWMCPQPLYGVPLPDFELRQEDGGGGGTTDEATDGSNERG